MVEVTLVIPLYNEEKRLSLEYFRALAGVRGVSLMLVDDGSTDATLEMISGSNEPWRIKSLERNMGKAEAIRLGLWGLGSALEHQGKEESPRYVGYLDGDGAIPVSALEAFLKAIDGSVGKTCYLASRVRLLGSEVTRSEARHFISRFVVTFLSALAPKYFMPYDPQCGLKIFKVNGPLISSIKQRFHTKWFFDLELLRRLVLFGDNPGNWAEVPLKAWREVEGSKVRPLPAVQDLLRVTAIFLKGIDKWT